MRKTEWEMDMDEQNARDRDIRAVGYEKAWNPRAFDSSREIVDKAIRFACEKHRDQKDDTGQPYFYAHIEPVVEILKHVTRNVSVIVAGYLHDTLEDTSTTYEELVEEFGEGVASLVNEVTHEEDKEHGGYYFPRLKTREGIMIKFADRLNNLSRMENWGEDRKEQYLRKSKFWKS